MSGRQGDLAISADSTVACPLEGCVRRFHRHLTGYLAIDRYSSQCETTFWGLSPHHHEMQKQNREIHHVQESCESQTGVLHAIRWTGEQLGVAVFKSVGNNTKSQYFSL